MKKLISFVLGAFIALGIFGFSFSADSLLDYLGNIGKDIVLFGYRPNTDKISVDSITATSIVIKSPILKDEFGDTISNYDLLYGPNTLEQIIANPTLITDTKEKPFANLSLAGKTNVEMTLTTVDVLNPNTIYYVLSRPKDSSGGGGEISNELCFRLRDQIHGEGDECANGLNNHGAGADMKLANISHTKNGNNLTLRWITVSGSDKVDIFLWNESTSNFVKLSTVNMSDETYTFTLTRDGEHIVKFIPNNGGKEINYTFNVLGIASPVPQPNGNPNISKVTPVVVGPRENLIAIVVGTIIIYLGYRIVKRKA